MSIIDFVKTLLPRMEKSTIEEDIKVTHKELTGSVIPQYRQAAEYFRTTKIKSKELLEYSEYFYRNNRFAVKGPNFIFDMSLLLANMADNLVFIQKQVHTVMESSVLNEGITVKKAHLLRAAGLISYVSRNSLDILNYFLQLEAAGTSKPDLTPAKLKSVKESIDRVFRVIEDYGIQPDKFSKVILAVPEVVITTGNAESIESMFDKTAIEPFSKAGASNFTGNPIFVIRMQIAQWQVNRYTAATDKKKLLELRLLHLKMQAEKTPAPQLEKEIDYLQERVNKLDRQIRAVEDTIDEEAFA